MADRVDGARDWVQRRREQGFTDSEIRGELAQRGWSQGRIDEVMGGPEEPAPPPPPSAKRRSGDARGVWFIVAVGCLLAAVAIIGVIAAIVFPVFVRSREKAREASCLSNVKQLSIATLMYAQDCGERLSLVSNWPERIFPYIRQQNCYRCPSDESTSGAAATSPWPLSYGMNAALDARQLRDVASPAQTPALCEAHAAQGGPEIAEFRHNMGANVGFVDGHAKWVYEQTFPSLWTSATSPPGRPQAPDSVPQPRSQAPDGAEAGGRADAAAERASNRYAP